MLQANPSQKCGDMGFRPMTRAIYAYAYTHVYIYMYMSMRTCVYTHVYMCVHGIHIHMCAIVDMGIDIAF